MKPSRQKWCNSREGRFDTDAIRLNNMYCDINEERILGRELKESRMFVILVRLNVVRYMEGEKDMFDEGMGTCIERFDDV